jgi:hypothetical protein
MSVDRLVAAVRAVLPSSVPVAVVGGAGTLADLRIGRSRVRAGWLARGGPRQVREALATSPQPALLIAPVMSPGARALLDEAGVGWIDETGAAQLVIGSLVVSRDGAPPSAAAKKASWTPATLGVAEAVLTGAEPTVSAVVHATRLSVGSVSRALAYLAASAFLTADQQRGRLSARRILDADGLLDSYAEAAVALRTDLELRVGVVWRDPTADVVEAASGWEQAARPWAATSSLAAAVLAPVLTQIAPLEIYVEAASSADLQLAAREIGARAVEGGRLLLRAFPGSATERLSETVGDGVRCVPWPRVYADLRQAGVRGEDAAEHLRESFMKGELHG